MPSEVRCEKLDAWTQSSRWRELWFPKSRGAPLVARFVWPDTTLRWESVASDRWAGVRVIRR